MLGGLQEAMHMRLLAWADCSLARALMTELLLFRSMSRAREPCRSKRCEARSLPLERSLKDVLRRS